MTIPYAKPGDAFQFAIVDDKGTFIVKIDGREFYMAIPPDELRKLASAILSVADELEGKL